MYANHILCVDEGEEDKRKSGVEEKGWRGCVTQLMISVQPTGEHCASFTEENSVVNSQCKSKAGRREGHCCRHQLHCLTAMAKSPTSAVTTGEGCPGTGDEACVELSKAHRSQVSA